MCRNCNGIFFRSLSNTIDPDTTFELNADRNSFIILLENLACYEINCVPYNTYIKQNTYIHTYIHTYIYIYIYAQKLWPHARMDVTDCNNIAFAWKQEIFRTCCNILQELRCTYVCKNAFKSQHVFDWRIRRLVAHR